jgi:hypothetical protein
MQDFVNGYYIVQDGPRFYTAIQLACSENGKELNHLLIISGPFDSYELADLKRKGQNVR